jgi:D-alanine-D-alanine ligase
MKPIPVAVLFGGRSVEHEVSVLTGLEAIDAMDRHQYQPIPVYIAQDGRWYTGPQLLQRSFYRTLQLATLDQVTLLPHPGSGGLYHLKSGRTTPISCFFLAMHGSNGEDGTLQGLLELAQVPYTGCDVAASAVTMDKWLTKSVLRAHNLPVLPDQRVDREEARTQLTALVDQLLTRLQFPLIVKPSRLGSSVGVHRVETREKLAAALVSTFNIDRHALVEPCIDPLLEINVSILHHQGAATPSVVEIPFATQQTLTYEDKYLRDGGAKVSHGSLGMAGASRIIDPSDLDPAVEASVQSIACQAYTLLGCRGVARCDFIYDTAQSQLYFNELNPIPGSLSYYLWSRSNPRLLYPSLIDHLIQEAISRHAEAAALSRKTPSGLFSKM